MAAMMKPEILTIKLFRTEPGDVGICDVSCSYENLAEAQRITTERLESYSNDPQRRSQDKPTKAYLIGEDDRLIAEYRITPQGAEIVLKPRFKRVGWSAWQAFGCRPTQLLF